jgi:DNA-binding MarR family transcriptional regulator
MPDRKSCGDVAVREGGRRREARPSSPSSSSSTLRVTGLPEDTTMDLQAFFPYRLAVLAEQVSLAVAPVYAARFRLSRQEWRILAVVGARAEFSTSEICRTTTLDKMQVSRAIQSLEARGFVKRFEAPGDRRRKIVALTAAGRSLYRRIVPLASKREAAILRGLSAQEIAQFNATMAKIAAAASALRGGDDE